MTYGRIPANRNRDGKFRECHASGEQQNRAQCVFIVKEIHDGVRLYGEEWARWPVALWAARDAWLVKASEHSCAQAERDGGFHWLWGTGRRALTLFVFSPTCKLRHAQLCSPVIVSPLKSSSRLTSWPPSLPYLTSIHLLILRPHTLLTRTHHEVLPCFHPGGVARRPGHS
jgi:hypothetical protein